MKKREKKGIKLFVIIRKRGIRDWDTWDGLWWHVIYLGAGQRSPWQTAVIHVLVHMGRRHASRGLSKHQHHKRPQEVNRPFSSQGFFIIFVIFLFIRHSKRTSVWEAVGLKRWDTNNKCVQLFTHMSIRGDSS